MAVVLGTTIKWGKDGKSKVIAEGTPLNKLTKAEKEYAKEHNLLVVIPDDIDEILEADQEEVDDPENPEDSVHSEDEAEDSEDE
jgi:hypothetical protein